MDILKTELQTRIGKLQQVLVKHQLDAYIICDTEDIWYYSNINYSPEQRPFILIIYPDAKPRFIVPKLEESHVQVPYFDYDLTTYFDVTSKPGDNWYDVLRKYICPLKTVGIEDNAPLYITEKLDNNWRAKEYVKELRAIKSAYEIEKIEVVAKLTSAVMNTTLGLVKTGTTVMETLQVPAKYYAKELAQFQGLNQRVTNVVWPADFSYMPHSIPAIDATIGAGANVDIAIFKLDGYAAECERTFFTELPSEEEKNYFNAMLEARNIMFSLIRPGIKVSAIEEAILAYFEKMGVADKVLHRPGHGLGLNNHEEPTISRGNDTLLEENMVISVEPGLYVKGLGGFRHSDTVLVTKDGYRSLTDAPADLTSLILKNK